jgi:hypothetical protein
MRAASSSCFSFKKVSRVASPSRQATQSHSRASIRVLIRVRRAARTSASTGIRRRPIVTPLLEVVAHEMWFQALAKSVAIMPIKPVVRLVRAERTPARRSSSVDVNGAWPVWPLSDWRRALRGPTTRAARPPCRSQAAIRTQIPSSGDRRGPSVSRGGWRDGSDALALSANAAAASLTMALEHSNREGLHGRAPLRRLNPMAPAFS